MSRIRRLEKEIIRKYYDIKGKT
jgi:hypothetical protein